MEAERARALLGVSVVANATTIRRRYHALARDLHPDAGGDLDGFQELQDAYATLLEQKAPADRRRADAPPPPDRAAERRARADLEREEREREHPIDLDTIDWERTPPTSPTRVDHELLAVVGATLAPLAPLVAVSRGPRGVLNRVAHVLDDALTTRMEFGVAFDEGVGIRLEARTVRGRKLLLALRSLHGWSVNRLSTDIVFATRPVELGPYQQVNALRYANVASEALDHLDWPLGTWTITAPLAG